MFAKFALFALAACNIAAAANPSQYQPPYQPPAYTPPKQSDKYETKCETKYYTSTKVATSYKHETLTTKVPYPTTVITNKPCTTDFTKTISSSKIETITSEKVVTKTVPVVITTYKTETQKVPTTSIKTVPYTTVSVGHSAGTCPATYTSTAETTKYITTEKPYPVTSTAVSSKAECTTKKSGYGY